MTTPNKHSERGERLRQPARPGKVVPPNGGMRPHKATKRVNAWEVASLLRDTKEASHAENSENQSQAGVRSIPGD
jgi:hypothetical protein